MPEPTPETARRALLKSADVCELAKVQPYVLRSWEKEFPDLGMTRAAGGPRFYRRADVDRVLRIRHLVFGEGLTLGGARRRLDEERTAQAEEELPFEDVVVAPAPAVTADTRAKLEGVKQGLRSLLHLLGTAGEGGNGPRRTEARRKASPEPRLPIEDPVTEAVAASARKGRAKRRPEVATE